MNQRQRDIRAWLLRNFPDTNVSQQFMKLIKELGELAQVVVKWEQGIYTGPSPRIAMKKELGDVLIVVNAIGALLDLDTEEAFDYAWGITGQRNWVKFREERGSHGDNEPGSEQTPKTV